MRLTIRFLLFAENGGTSYPAGTYAAESAGKWVLDFYANGILDGPTVDTSTPRYIGGGAVTNIAGSTDRVAIANGNAQITWFDPSNTTPQGSEDQTTNYVALSTDGSVMAATSPNETLLDIYSLPSGTVTNTISIPYTAGQNFSLSLSGSGTTYATDNGYGDKNGSSDTAQVAPVSGGAAILSMTGPSLGFPVALSPDGTLAAICCDADTGNTLIFRNGTQVASVVGEGIGWIDNDRLLATTDQGDVIFSAAGTQLATVALPNFQAFQTVTSDTIYVPRLNAIYSLTTGNPTWTSPYHADGDGAHWQAGAVAGSYVVYESEGNVIATPY